MKKKWVVCVACILILCMTAAVPVFAAGKNAQNDKTDYLDEMTGELDFSKLDHFMGQDAGDGGITFSELVEEFRERYISSLAPGWSANYVSRSAKTVKYWWRWCCLPFVFPCLKILPVRLRHLMCRIFALSLFSVSWQC